jgi:hypothetical protein
VKQWAVGDVLSAADMNAWTVPLVAVKPADTGRNTTTTPTADPDLQVAVAAGATYQVTATIQYKGGGNGGSDAKFGISAPASSTGFMIVTRQQITSFPTTTTDWNALGGVSNAGTNGTGNTLPCRIDAVVTTAGTAGNISVIWAQNTSNGTNTTVIANSTLVAQRIG